MRAKKLLTSRQIFRYAVPARTVTKNTDYYYYYNQAMGGSVVEWLACWTRAQKGPGSNRSRDTVG